MSSRLGELDFTGESGRTYRFHLYVWRTRFKAVPAVYVVTERSVEPDSAPSYKPLFVGSTRDLSAIFDDHPRQDCFDLYYANTIGVLPEPDESARRRIEQDLAATLAPPCNLGDELA